MIIALAANLLNVGLNWLLIEGNWGAPAMGADGAALATSITRWIMFGALAGYVWTMRDGARFGIRSGLRNQEETIRKILRLGHTARPYDRFGGECLWAGRHLRRTDGRGPHGRLSSLHECRLPGLHAVDRAGSGHRRACRQCGRPPSSARTWPGPDGPG